MFNSSWTVLLSRCSTYNDTSSLVLFQTNCEIFYTSWIRFHGYLPCRQCHIITVDTFCGSPVIYRFPWRYVRHSQPHYIFFYIFRAPDDIHSSTYVLFSKIDRICSTYVLLNKMDRICCVWNANHVIYLMHLTICIIRQIKCADYVVFEMFHEIIPLVH